ncbi:MAG: hypothetical protein IJS75_03890 [Bacteroidales bacterium]|nr:hypothetical protein [Bacteroidales bacterium]
MADVYVKYREDLTAHMLEVATGNGLLSGTLLNSPDLDAAYHFLMKSGTEPGTTEAYRFFLISVEIMYKIGAAIELHRLGYKFEKI